MAKHHHPDLAADGTLDLPQRAKLIIMGSVLLGLFLSALDQTIVGTAMPRILTDLHGNDLYTWVITAYLLTSTITIPIYGKLSDVFGRKYALLFGIAVFLVGSALSGLSQTSGELITFRAIQGLGAGALFPISLAIIGDLFNPRDRGRYQGLFGAVFGISFLIGPFLGGFLTDHFSWHWVFYVNLPVGLIALAVIATVLPNLARSEANWRTLDYTGVALFAAGVVPILLGLTYKGLTDAQGNPYDWVSLPVFGLIGVGLVLLAGFLVNEFYATEPIVPLDLFRNRTYAATQAASFLVSFSMFSTITFIPRFYQVVRGVSATSSGYQVWPLLIGLLGASIGTGFLISKVGRPKWILVVGLGILTLGTVLMTNLTSATTDIALWTWLLLIGLGIGPAMSGFTTVIQNLVPRDRIGAATSTLTFLRQIGGSVGLAVAGTIFSSGFTRELSTRLAADGVPRQAADRISAGNNSGLTSVGDLQQTLVQRGIPAQLAGHTVQAVHEAFSLAVAGIFWISTAAAVLGFLAFLSTRDSPLRGAALLDPLHPDPVAGSAA